MSVVFTVLFPIPRTLSCIIYLTLKCSNSSFICKLFIIPSALESTENQKGSEKILVAAKIDVCITREVIQMVNKDGRDPR